MPLLIHTVSNINEAPQDISLISDTSNSEPFSSQITSPAPSQTSSIPFNLPQRPVTSIGGILSQAQWNHPIKLVNSSPSFQSSLPLSYQGDRPIKTLNSNSPTSDADQFYHHCIGIQTDTTRTYTTLPVKLEP